MTSACAIFQICSFYRAILHYQSLLKYRHLSEKQEHITANYYQCSKQVFSGLGEMYGNGGEFTKNINTVAGDGTAEFVSSAIKVYCR